MLDERVDLDDRRVVDGREEAPLGDGGGAGAGVSGVEQPLEHDPQALHAVVEGQVDPALAAVGDRAHHLVAGGPVAGAHRGADPVARAQPRGERERLLAVGAEAGRAARPPLPTAPHRLLAPVAEPLVLGHHRVGLYQQGRVRHGCLGHLHQPGAEPAHRRPGRLRAPGPAGPRGAGRGQRRGGARRHRGLGRRLLPRRRRQGGRRQDGRPGSWRAGRRGGGGSGPALVAEPVRLDCAAASRLLAPEPGGRRRRARLLSHRVGSSRSVWPTSFAAYDITSSVAASRSTGEV